MSEPETAATGGRVPAGEGVGRFRWRIFLVAVALFWLLELGWSLSLPLGSGPDEGAHMVKAAAVVRGEWLGTHPHGAAMPFMAVFVPATEAHTPARTVAVCYYARPAVPASCQPPIRPSGAIVATTTHVGRYPPLYYLVVGVPTLFTPSIVALYLMRALSDLLNALALALALALVVRFRGGRLLGAAILVCLTPVALFEMALVEPSGLETSVAVLVWVAVALLARLPGGTVPPRLLVNCAGAAACVLVLVRGLSPLWLALILATALILSPPETRSAIAHSRAARRWGVAIAVSTAAAVAWIVGFHTLAVLTWPRATNPYAAASTGHVVRLLLAKEQYFLRQMVGLEISGTDAGLLVSAAAEIAIATLVVLGLVRGTARQRLAIGFTLVTAALVPIAASLASDVQRNGLLWDGRYLLPFAVGVPLISAIAAAPAQQAAEDVGDQPAVASALPAILGGIAVFVMPAAEWAALRRFAVGVHGPTDLLSLTSPRWHPAVPVPVLAAAVPILALGLGGFAFAACARRHETAAAAEPVAPGAPVLDPAGPTVAGG